jgi:hypothetical protein
VTETPVACYVNTSARWIRRIARSAVVNWKSHLLFAENVLNWNYDLGLADYLVDCRTPCQWGLDVGIIYLCDV